MDGFFADYGCTFLRVSNTSAVLAADAGITKMCNELAATTSLVGSLWMESSPTMFYALAGVRHQCCGYRRCWHCHDVH